jgi:septal ring factor EnvC (AmiA/AmiB activator)
MDAAFFNHDTAPRSWRRAFVPLRRVLRRIQRPYFQRLHDLLHNLSQTSRAQQAELQHLQHQAAAAQATIAELRQTLRAFQVDYTAVTRRMAHLEDLLLDTLDQSDEQPRILPLRKVA